MHAVVYAFLCDRKVLSHKTLREDRTAAVRKYVAEATRRRRRILRAGFFFLEEGHAQINRIFVFLYGGRHVDHLVYREYRRACHSDWCLAADRLPAILLWIGIKKKDKKRS